MNYIIRRKNREDDDGIQRFQTTAQLLWPVVSQVDHSVGRRRELEFTVNAGLILQDLSLKTVNSQHLS